MNPAVKHSESVVVVVVMVMAAVVIRYGCKTTTRDYLERQRRPFLVLYQCLPARKVICALHIFE